MLKNEPEIWDAETDFLSVGSGIGGLSAAITAREMGLEAMVLEKADQVGGVQTSPMERAVTQATAMPPRSAWKTASKAGFAI